MNCKYCNTLIIHRFNGNYTKMDKRRKQVHEKNCEENPENWDMEKIKEHLHKMARYTYEMYGTYDIEILNGRKTNVVFRKSQRILNNE